MLEPELRDTTWQLFINIIIYTLIGKDAVMDKESSLQTAEKDDTMGSKLVV